MDTITTVTLMKILRAVVKGKVNRKSGDNSRFTNTQSSIQEVIEVSSDSSNGVVVV